MRKTHGMSNNTREYNCWQNMKKRCLVPTHDHFKYYGERGITVCDRWKNSFECFLSDMGMCPSGMTLDRIDNDRGYGPSNCRWATLTEQRRNRRDISPLWKTGMSQIEIQRTQWRAQAKRARDRKAAAKRESKCV